MREQAAKRWPYLGRLLPDFDLPSPRSDDAQTEQERLFWAVEGFLQMVAAERAPVALMLDDLHWADRSSLDLLLHLARHTRGHRVLLLGTYRDVEVGRQHPLEATLRELHRQELMERIAVRRLDEEGTAALLAADLGEDRVSDEFAGLLYQRTEGNPFFVQQGRERAGCTGRKATRRGKPGLSGSWEH